MPSALLSPYLAGGGLDWHLRFIKLAVRRFYNSDLVQNQCLIKTVLNETCRVITAQNTNHFQICDRERYPPFSCSLRSNAVSICTSGIDLKHLFNFKLLSSLIHFQLRISWRKYLSKIWGKTKGNSTDYSS